MTQIKKRKFVQVKKGSNPCRDGHSLTTLDNGRESDTFRQVGCLAAADIKIRGYAKGRVCAKGLREFNSIFGLDLTKSEFNKIIKFGGIGQI